VPLRLTSVTVRRLFALRRVLVRQLPQQKIRPASLPSAPVRRSLYILQNFLG